MIVQFKKLASIATLCDDLAEVVQAHAEQRWGQSIPFIDGTREREMDRWIGALSAVLRALFVPTVIYGHEI